MATAPNGMTWRSGQNATAAMESDYLGAATNENLWHGHNGLLEYYLPKFYAHARGHLLNKYHVGLYGPYVDEALRVMDRNAWADKYTLSSEKTFVNRPGEHYKHDEFMDWLEMCYDKESGILNMFWAAESVTIPGAKADVQWAMIDSTKTMSYPLIKAVTQPADLQLNIIDDPYMMWFNFFNALFNVQFSPLVLKPRSTLQKINVMVDLYYEGITTAASHNPERKDIGWQMTKNGACITDLQVGQMFEFNSCVLTAAPSTKMGYGEGSSYKFNVNFKYPNAFQGSFKDTFRYLRDNTTRGVDNNDSTTKPTTVATSVYGEFNKGFYETPYNKLQSNQKAEIYETFQKNDYKNYANTTAAAFKDTNYHYDMNGSRKK